MPDRIKLLEDRLKDLRDDLRTIDKAHLDRYHSLKTDTDAVKLLIDGHRRSETALDEHDSRLVDLERVAVTVQRNERRIADLEAMKIAVLADRLDRLSKQVAWMIGAFITLILTTLGGIIVYLVSSSNT